MTRSRNSLDAQIAELNGDQLVESGTSYLSEQLAVDDPLQAADHVLALLGRPGEPAVGLQDAADETAQQDTKEVVGLLRLALRDAAATSEPIDRLAEIVRGAGEKQCVVTPDLLALAVILLVGYLTVRNEGKQSETIEVTREEGTDGKIKVTTKAATKYIDPFSALGRLLKAYIPGLNGQGDA